MWLNLAGRWAGAGTFKTTLLFSLEPHLGYLEMLTVSWNSLQWRGQNFYIVAQGSKMIKMFLSLLAILWNSTFNWVSLSLSICLLLLFFSQLFVRPPQTTILLFAYLFLGDGLDPCLLYSVMNLRP